jgi:hypothetical protein
MLSAATQEANARILSEMTPETNAKDLLRIAEAYADTLKDKREEELARPLSEHPAFEEISSAVELIESGAKALRGIGLMLTPSSKDADEPLELVSRSDGAAVFDFFSIAMRPAIERVSRAADLLQTAAHARERV